MRLTMRPERKKSKPNGMMTAAAIAMAVSNPLPRLRIWRTRTSDSRFQNPRKPKFGRENDWEKRNQHGIGVKKGIFCDGDEIKQLCVCFDSMDNENDGSEERESLAMASGQCSEERSCRESFFLLLLSLSLSLLCESVNVNECVWVISPRFKRCFSFQGKHRRKLVYRTNILRRFVLFGLRFGQHKSV